MGLTTPMVAAEISEGAETSPEGELSPASRKRRSPLLTFGIGLTVLVGLVAIVLLGSEFLASAADRDAGIWLKLEPGMAAAP